MHRSKHQRRLREIAKFASGLITADFLVGLWLYVGGHLPIAFLGLRFNTQTTLIAMVFDLFVLALLIIYAWHLDDHPKNSKERIFHLGAGLVFGIVALLHLLRIVFGLNFSLGSWQVPYWLNALGAVITAFLSYLSFYWYSRD